MRRIGLYLLFFFLALGVKAQTEVRVATASSVRFAMEALIEAFEAKHEGRVKMITGSSGKLSSQILQKAPYDLFVAANEKYPRHLHEKGRTVGKPHVYGYGVPVLWTMKGITKDELHLDVLQKNEVKKIAMADPKTAPFGQLAQQILQDVGLMNSLLPKIVQGSNVSQVDQFILSGNVDIGITSRSVVMAPKMKNKGTWVRLEKGTLPQAAAIIDKKRGEDQEELVGAFYRFLFAQKAMRIWRKYGYEISKDL